MRTHAHRPLMVLALGLALTACGEEEGETPAEKAEYHYKLASGDFSEQNIQKAIRELTEAIELKPDHAKAHHLLGFIYFGRHSWRKAEKHLRKAVSLDPDFRKAIANLGNLYLAMEEWEAAVPYFRKLLEDPRYETPYLAHNNLGWALYKLGRFDEARKHLDRAVFLNPKFCLGFNNSGRLYAHRGRTEKALEAFAEAVELCPDYAEPHYFLGRIHSGLSQPRRARKHFRKCRKLGKETSWGERCKEQL